MDGSMQMEATPRACPQPGRWKGRAALAGGALAFVLGAAHFFRSGQHGLACVCLVWAGLLWRPVAWLRRSAAVFLLGLAAEWGMTTLALARWRLQLGQDWLRMVCILGAVAALTLLAAAALLAGLWAGLVYGWLADRRRAPVWRRRIWLLFSCVFFGQLLAGLFLHSLFLLQGVPHLPVPGLILSGPLYRGGGSLFMPGLFAVSLLLAGSAWCSHLCYLGVWDARAADAGPRSGRGVPALWRKMRWGLLAVSLLLPLGLRLAGLPWPWALVFALALGLALLPCALWLSRKLGIPVYCCGICPLGMTANLLARLSPWRLRRNGHCTGCGACARVCRYGALRLDGDGRVAGPGWRCTLCRDCMSVCRHRALEIRCCGQGGAWVEQALLCSLSVLHTLFLFMGRV